LNVQEFITALSRTDYVHGGTNKDDEYPGGRVK